MKTRWIGLITSAGLVLGFAAVAPAITDPVWPWGTNPKTDQPINGFCDALQAILDTSVTSMLYPLFPDPWSILAPATCDLNGTSYFYSDPLDFRLYGNGMLDCSLEMKLIEEVLRDTAFNISPHLKCDGTPYPGLTHQQVLDCFNANSAQFAHDIGSYWGLMGSLAPGVQHMLLAHMCMGDGDAFFSDPYGTPPVYHRVDAVGSAGFVKAVMYLLGDNVANPMIDLNQYVRMPEYFSKEGDADGDCASNYCELQVRGAANYVSNALDPAVGHLSDCVCCVFLEVSSVTGGGWHEEGAPFQLTVAVVNEAGAVSYRWYKDGTPLANGTDATYVVDHPTADDSGIYTCTMFDQNPTYVSTGPIAVNVLAAGSLPVAGLAAGGAALVALIGLGVAAIRKGHKR